jgi:copper chaperone NosL
MLAAIAGRRVLLYTWLTGFAGLAVAGLYDFWRWEYDYGHNIDFEHAIIKVPGMTYQPPLLGTKQMLNITASSWPALGAVCLGVAFVLGIVALILVRRTTRRPGQAAAVALAVATAACAPATPRAIANAGRSCDYCRMTISDERFGGQIITRKAKVYAFDSVECMAGYYLREAATLEGSTLWVADFSSPGHWLPATTARYARSEAHPSPMGLNLVSFAAGADSTAIPSELEGAALSWAQVLAVVQREWDARPVASGAGRS